MTAPISRQRPSGNGPAQDAVVQRLQEANERLSREVAAHEATLRELESVRRDLELRVAERTKELSLVKARLETALRGANVYVFSQDRDLRYTWVYTPHGEDGGGLLGRTDAEVLPPLARAPVIALKKAVLASGEPAGIEVMYPLPDGPALVSLHVDPTYGPDGSIDGLMCAAMDVTRTRSLETEQRRLAQELASALQRYDTALRGSSVTVFTQDRHLRYTSISNPFLGKSLDEIVGATDSEILPVEGRDAMLKLKLAGLETGETQNHEVRLQDGAVAKWFDFHIEPVRDANGQIAGLTGAVVDITERKEGEAHLRLLMRELTHRSKNLLAVIQAMARQTARHALTTEGFLDQFGARLQALASSHDLLVQESWHGASLGDLVRSQVGHHLEGTDSQVSVEGGAYLLKPEAAQALGLALHELATNAAKYGALSVPGGRVAIRWERMPAADGHGIVLTWEERGGPAVVPPTRRGFGSLVIERNLARTLDAEVVLSFDPGGVRCRINIPVTQFLAAR